MTARMLSADEALGYGLVTRLADDPMAAARELAQTLKSRSPDAVNAIKALVDQTWTMAPGEGLAVEAALQAPIIGAPNQIEAVMANLRKRAPRFG